MSNGGYLQTKEGIQERANVIKAINEAIDEMVQEILDPQPDFDEQIKGNPFFAQGQAGLEKLRWDYKAGIVDQAA